MSLDKKAQLNNIYDWIDVEIVSKVKESLSNFFETEFITKFIALNDFENPKDCILLKNELFYTARVPVKNKQYILFRVSSDFIRIIFHDIFGSTYPVFNIESLTELETKILDELFEYIIKNINHLIIKETEPEKINPLNKRNLNLVILTENKNHKGGKLSVTIPMNRISPELVPMKQNFTFEDFEKNNVNVDILAGNSKLTLNELKSLEADDILILDRSDIRTMTLKTPVLTQKFKVNPNPSIMIDIDSDDEVDEDLPVNNKRGTKMPDEKTMWDDIQIEVNAEFKSVKMPLGDLKQISKGMVIDIAPVVDNEIVLLVEDKPVAKGELVIINDKYGVKIKDVFATNKKEPEQFQKQPEQPKSVQPEDGELPPPRKKQLSPRAKQAPDSEQQKTLKRQANPEQAEQDDDFDYSNFEE